jgi:hypothetical protein
VNQRPPYTSARADEAAQALIIEQRRIRLPGWRLASGRQDGELWVNDRKRLSLIWTIEEHDDGRLWMHISIASPDRTPRWDELVQAKEWMAGTDRYGYQVIPPRRRWINIHANALHVFVPWEGDPPLPEFSRDGKI